MHDKKKLRSPRGPFTGLDPAIALCKLEFIDYQLQVAKVRKLAASKA